MSAWFSLLGETCPPKNGIAAEGRVSARSEAKAAEDEVSLRSGGCSGTVTAGRSLCPLRGSSPGRRSATNLLTRMKLKYVGVHTWQSVVDH
jgi:hypothetical protein